MRHRSPSRIAVQCGFTAIEMLVVLSLAAVVLGGVVVAFGTIVRGVASMVAVPLGSTRLTNFYGSADTKPENTPTAPHYGMVALAEELREQFNTDVTSATAVFCLPRTGINTYRPNAISYDPAVHGELDTPQKFRAHLKAIGVSPLPYLDYRNPQNTAATSPAENATIFILGYSKTVNQMKVLALYDIDVIRFTGLTESQGFHASVKRYSDDTRGSTYPLAFSGGYAVFYPPSIPEPDPKKPSAWASDGFTPLFITFERSTRLAWAEGVPIDRFKKAAERSFYFVWWPDPGARHLGPISNASIDVSDMRQAYNHMGGRTSFMFTVPMFPAL
jgi:prepilin-type N-terminal cleavage/methylation domain-containing protein